ncbi:MarR family winged helix-turn-helix transcriptional regulator [Enterococcus sp. DIV0187]|uniref:MarR family winged helix-turn-helix transcriptional regulator n=1 Tax=Enterococcus sp. DIV0187 TaxID=2774644 RepID=UPI003F225682
MEDEVSEFVLVHRVISTLFTASKKVQNSGEEILEILSYPQLMLIIVTTYLSDEDISMHDLANKMGLTIAEVRHILGTLRKHGLAENEVINQDRRKRRIKVTEKGYEALDRESKNVNAFIAPLFVDFSYDELKQLLRLLEKLNSFSGEGTPFWKRKDTNDRLRYLENSELEKEITNDFYRKRNGQ